MPRMNLWWRVMAHYKSECTPQLSTNQCLWAHRTNVELESSTAPGWLSTTQSTYLTDGISGKSDRVEWNKSSTVSIVNFTLASGGGSETSRVSTQSSATTGTGVIGGTSTRKSKKGTTRRPSTRLKLGQMSTTTEVVTENMFLLSTASSCLNVTEYKITDQDLIGLNETDKNLLRKLCWETMFGQELVKLTVMDFVMVVVSTLSGDFIRALIVRSVFPLWIKVTVMSSCRYCNGCTCIFWDLEKGWPGYADFKIAENILHLVNNQGMIWYINRNGSHLFTLSCFPPQARHVLLARTAGHQHH